MKHNFIAYFICTFILSVFFTGCKQNEPMDFADDGRIYFYEHDISLTTTAARVYEKNFSFAILSESLTEADAKINVRIMGRVSDKDRIFQARVVADSSSVNVEQYYKLHDGVVKAGEIDSYLPVTIYRTPNMKDEIVKLYFEIVATGDFGDNVYNGNAFILRVSDKLMKPSTWTLFIDQYLGAYSDNKYKFIIDVLGITEFPFTRSNAAPVEGTYSPPQMQAFNMKLKEAYELRLRTTGPIYVEGTTDEITFP
jgi:hypothetical protein